MDSTGEKVVEKKTHRNPSIPLEGLKISSRIFCWGMGTNCTGATRSGVFFQPGSFSEKTSHQFFSSKKQKCFYLFSSAVGHRFHPPKPWKKATGSQNLRESGLSAESRGMVDDRQLHEVPRPTTKKVDTSQDSTCLAYFEKKGRRRCSMKNIMFNWSFLIDFGWVKSKTLWILGCFASTSYWYWCCSTVFICKKFVLSPSTVIILFHGGFNGVQLYLIKPSPKFPPLWRNLKLADHVLTCHLWVSRLLRNDLNDLFKG